MTSAPEAATTTGDGGLQAEREAAAPRRSPTVPDPTADAAWDAFVADGRPGSYLQLAGWARVKAVNGWTHERIVSGVDHPSISGAPSPPDAASVVGAQVLLRRPRPLPWTFAYAPRGPVTAAWTTDTIAAFTDACRAALPSHRVSHLRIDPELERDAGIDEGGALPRSVRAAGVLAGLGLALGSGPDRAGLIVRIAIVGTVWLLTSAAAALLLRIGELGAIIGLMLDLIRRPRRA